MRLLVLQTVQAYEGKTKKRIIYVAQRALWRSLCVRQPAVALRSAYSVCKLFKKRSHFSSKYFQKKIQRQR
jgi:hypothetical protein